MRADPHSWADLEQGRCIHAAFRFVLDPDRRHLETTTTLTFERAITGPLDLDTRGLTLHEVVDEHGAYVHRVLAAPHPILGARLRLQLTGTRQVTLVTTTSDASALMWLTPAQTAGGVHPFVLTQCQAIHARSLAPLQDTPLARIRYDAVLDVPAALTGVMSAAPGTSTVVGDRRHLSFTMPQPIPPYLLAFAVGDLASRDLDPRCRVFAEPSVVDDAAWEFAEVGAMLRTAERLFGPYRWDRYDFIVLPPSFPLGGMENPRMTFLTPTLLAGDRSLVGVLAHELAHSWTGNLVTNATNEHFWLNEGWTVWAERRIVEALYGEEEARQQAILGRRALEATLLERRARGERTALTYVQDGLDPDAAFSRIPYEGGFLLISALERAVGRERFDRFVQDYIDRFAFEPITTSAFLAFADAELDHGLDLHAWVEADDIPPEAPRWTSARLDALHHVPLADLPTDLSLTEKLYVLDHTRADPAALATHLGVVGTGNAELRTSWLTYALRAGATGLEDALRSHVDTIGRTKLLVPVLRAMRDRDDLSALAEELVEANRARWHVSTRQALGDLGFVS
jgi:aminopeptidase N